MKNTNKTTMTMKQLRRLIKEASLDDYSADDIDVNKDDFITKSDELEKANTEKEKAEQTKRRSQWISKAVPEIKSTFEKMLDDLQNQFSNPMPKIFGKAMYAIEQAVQTCGSKQYVYPITLIYDATLHAKNMSNIRYKEGSTNPIKKKEKGILKKIGAAIDNSFTNNGSVPFNLTVDPDTNKVSRLRITLGRPFMSELDSLHKIHPEFRVWPDVFSWNGGYERNTRNEVKKQFQEFAEVIKSKIGEASVVVTFNYESGIFIDFNFEKTGVAKFKVAWFESNDKKEITYGQLKKFISEAKDNRYEITFKYGPYTDRKIATTVIYAQDKDKALHKFEISKEHEYYADLGLDKGEEPGDIHIIDVKEFIKSWKLADDEDDKSIKSKVVTDESNEPVDEGRRPNPRGPMVWHVKQEICDLNHPGETEYDEVVAHKTFASKAEANVYYDKLERKITAYFKKKYGGYAGENYDTYVISVEGGYGRPSRTYEGKEDFWCLKFYRDNENEDVD